ncbi:MAG TPA: hypothetical protein VNE39_17700 [Planctomycetota bacterium]|nr:hypothetical protein [Planctomycetota bacterium]
MPALGGGKEEAQYAGLTGALVVCKQYATVVGTFLSDVRGADIARLNYLFGEDVNPRFSPNGGRILFTSTRGGTPGLWTMSREGAEPKRVCDGDQGDWFPDGRRIAFRRRGQIVGRSLATGEESVISPTGRNSCSWPACSPDGRQILFVVGRGADDAIFLMTPGAVEPKRLAEGETLGAPRWAPTGDRIAYQSGAHIWMMDADGSHKRQLTTTGGIQRRPAWSPDGTAIAYCQGPRPKGPWQIAVTRTDGTRTFLVPPGAARSVLCPDWGVERPGRRPTPQPVQGTAVRPPPRIHLWEIAPPLAAVPADWAAFCRERKGWNAVPFGNALPRNSRGGYVVENDKAVLLLLAGSAGAVLIPNGAGRSAIELGPLDPQGRAAGPVESVRVLRYGPEECALESSSRSEGAPLKASWSLGGSRALVQVTPIENAGKLRIAAPLQCVVATDRFGDDVVVGPETLGEGRAFLPWAPVVTGLLGDGSDLLVVVCPEQGQRMELRKGKERSLLGADVAFQGRCVSAGVVSGERTWHLERFGTEGQPDPLRFKWQMPFEAAWRLTVRGDGKRYSTFFREKESAFFDKKDALFRRTRDFAAAVRLGAIYLYDRTASTPLDALTPADLVRDALGLQAAQRALDEEGLTGYRRAAGPTTWAELSVTIESLRFLFQRQLEAQDSVYAGHLCDDIPLFVEGMDQRLAEYAGFAREVLSANVGPAAAKLEGATSLSQRLGELGEKQRSLRSPKEVLPLCARIRQLTAKESRENRKRFEECCKELLAAVGPREEMLKAYRKLAVELRDAAGSAPLTRPDLIDAAEKIMTSCQSVLRNRFYIEGGWRGEDYEVPAFWLGPRPYE